MFSLLSFAPLSFLSFSFFHVQLDLSNLIVRPLNRSRALTAGYGVTHRWKVQPKGSIDESEIGFVPAAMVELV